jgi:hypothetical protein
MIALKKYYPNHLSRGTGKVVRVKGPFNKKAMKK